MPKQSCSEAPAEKSKTNLTPAQRALQARVVAGKAAASCAQRELKMLDKTVNELSHALRSLLTGEPASTTQHEPYLYGLLAGRPVSMIRSIPSILEPEHESDSDSESRCCCNPLKISTPWQKSVADVWVIGVDIENCGEKHLFELTLVLTVPFRSFQHNSKFFLVDEKFSVDDDPSDEPPPKKLCLEDGYLREATEPGVRALAPGQHAVLTLAFSLEMLGHRSELGVNLAVAFKRKNDGGVSSNCIDCSPVTITMHDVISREPMEINTELSGTVAVHALAALDAYTDTVENLVLVARETTLNDVKFLLQLRGDMTFHPYLEILYWRKASPQRLWNAWLVLGEVASQFKVHISVHTRDRFQFFEVVHYLYGKLPADILILPDTDTSVPALSSCLLKESNLIAGFLRNVAEEQLEVDNIDEYCEFRNQLFKLEQETDAAMAFTLSSGTSK